MGKFRQALGAGLSWFNGLSNDGKARLLLAVLMVINCLFGLSMFFLVWAAR